MPYTTINKSTDHFNTKLYTGNNGTNAITGVGFQPDWVWLRPRNATDAHRLMNSVRGASYYLMSNATNKESATGSNFASFDSDGFTLGGSDGGWNSSSYNYVSWNWLAANGTASNGNGSITSTVSANTTAGFSIVKYTATGSNATVGHGLGVAPSVIIIKDYEDNGGSNWIVYHKSLGATKYLELNDIAAEATGSTYFYNTAPTNQVFSIGTSSQTNNTGNDTIAYCFAEKSGHSKFGSYTGNGNADGTFVYTGFKPAWVMIKRTNATEGWFMQDNKRTGFNPSNDRLEANDTGAESDIDSIDILSNGFKCTQTYNGVNASGSTYIYMAFGQTLVGSNDIPATAR